jgi:Transposase DDE domain group 1
LGADATLDARTESAMPTFADDTLLPFSLPSICQKKVTAAFDGGRISSDGGVLLLAGADKRLGLIDTLAAIIPDHRDPTLITHTMSNILRARVFAIACGYADADDLDDLRKDPAFKLACGRLRHPVVRRYLPAPAVRLGLSRAVEWQARNGRHGRCSGWQILRRYTAGRVAPSC